jgi:hypothetical protein
MLFVDIMPITFADIPDRSRLTAKGAHYVAPTSDRTQEDRAARRHLEGGEDALVRCEAGVTTSVQRVPMIVGEMIGRVA